MQVVWHLMELMRSAEVEPDGLCTAAITRAAALSQQLQPLHALPAEAPPGGHGDAACRNPNLDTPRSVQDQDPQQSSN